MKWRILWQTLNLLLTKTKLYVTQSDIICVNNVDTCYKTVQSIDEQITKH